MQDYIEQANKNGIELLSYGKCQFCGADTAGGVHECVSLFSMGFNLIDFSKKENHISRFLSVDAHTLQHPEIHGRWNNHFHLTRLHLILKHGYKWSYETSPLLSKYLNGYKKEHEDEMLLPPEPLQRGKITTTDILRNAATEKECMDLIHGWATEVYNAWETYHPLINKLAIKLLQLLK